MIQKLFICQHNFFKSKFVDLFTMKRHFDQSNKALNLNLKKRKLVT